MKSDVAKLLQFLIINGKNSDIVERLWWFGFGAVIFLYYFDNDYHTIKPDFPNTRRRGDMKFDIIPPLSFCLHPVHLPIFIKIISFSFC